MRDKRDVMRLHIQNGIRDLDGIRNSYNEFKKGGYTQPQDAIQSYAPRDRFEPIPISQEQQFNLKHFGQFNKPEQRKQTIQQPSNIKESQESKRIAEERINTRERLQKFEEQQRIDKERELKVAPYAAMGLIGAATGTLPAMIAGEIGGRTVDYGSRKLTGKSWGENVLPEAPIIGELTNPGYLIGGIKPVYNSIKRELTTDKLFHFSGNENLQFSDIDLFRPGTSQMKKRYANLPDEMKPGGFYTNKSAGKSFMGGNYGYEMRIPKKANILDLHSQGKITDRIPI